MRIPIFGTMVDERFLAHRQRSTSLAGFAGALVAIAWFWYRLFSNGVWRWDLLSVAIAMVVVKWALMLWYYLTD
jgi:hypothetical protein